MRIGVLGTGTVGRTLATKLASLGHEVVMGSREADNETALAWAREAGGHASQGTFEDAARAGQVVVNATAGAHSLEALGAAGHGNLEGKVLIDVANPLDLSRGMPPTLTVANDDSLGESIQRAVPGARVVKALNTVNADVMVDPDSVPGDHDVFVAGNDADAKAAVTSLLGEMGWPRERILDLGDITAARGTEMYLALWLRLLLVTGTPHLNIAVERAEA